MGKKTLKQVCRSACKSAGIAFWRLCGAPLLLDRGDACILLWHRIQEDGAEHRAGERDPLCHSPAVFAAQLAALKRRFRLIDLETLVDMSPEERRAQGPLCVLTFDDGWQDNFAQGLPILKQHNAPATIFLCSSFVDTPRQFWWQTLADCLRRCAELTPEERAALREALAASSDANSGAMPDEATFQDRDALLAWCKDQPGERVRGFVAAFAQALNLPDGERHSLNSAEIEEMCRFGCAFGSHTANHVILPVEDEETARQELAQSLDALRRLTGQKSAILAYPNGDWSERDIRLAAACGYRAAVTTQPDLLPPEITDPFRLPRIDCGGKNSADRLLFAIFRCALRAKWRKMRSRLVGRAGG